MKRAKRLNRAVTWVAAGVAAAALACGTLQYELVTDLKSPGEFTHTMTITATGPVAEGFGDEFDTSELTVAGWAVEAAPGEESYTIKASRTFTGEDAEVARSGTVPAPEGEAGSQLPIGRDGVHGFKVETTETADYTEYRVSLQLGGTVPEELDELTGETGPPEGVDPESAEYRQMQAMLEEALKGFLKVSWELKLPGRVQSHNAKTASAGTVKWEFDLESIQEADELFAVTRVEKERSGSCNR